MNPLSREGETEGYGSNRFFPRANIQLCEKVSLGKLAVVDVYFLTNVSAPEASLKLCIARCCLSLHLLHPESLNTCRFKL